MYEINEEMYQKNKTEKPQLLFANLPTNKKADVLVRVYVVAAVGLTPLDFGGSVDPYLVVKCGKTTIQDKDRYLTKELNPIFGRYAAYVMLKMLYMFNNVYTADCMLYSVYCIVYTV